MKHPRGTVLVWVPKALAPTCEGSAQRSPADRMVVLTQDTVMFARNGVIEQMDMYKTQDSYVHAVGTILDAIQPRLRVHAEEVARCNAENIVSEFNLIVTAMYEGRCV